MRATLVTLLVAFSLLVGACAAEEIPVDATITEETGADTEGEDHADETEDEDHDDETEDEGHDDDEADHDFWFGEPADASDADRVIEIEAADDFSFGPSAVSVAVGETVTFRVVNTGKIPHDFTIGDPEMQDDHEAEMSGGEMHEGEDPTAMLVQPGDTRDLTGTFTDSGPILIVCHVRGHYAAGMKASLEIDA